MRTQLIALVMSMLTLIPTGCATGFRATGPRGNGVTANAGVGQRVTPIVVQENSFVPPPPPTPPPPEAYR